MQSKLTLKLAERRAIVAKKKIAPAQNTLAAASVFDRLKQAVGCESDAALERAIGFNHGKVSEGRKANRMPYRAAIFVAIDRGASLDWILLGRLAAKS